MPRKLRWKLSDSICNYIKNAKLDFDKRIDDLDFCLLKYSKFGRDFPKKVKLSPDSFIQLSLQLSYYKYYNRIFNILIIFQYLSDYILLFLIEFIINWCQRMKVHQQGDSEKEELTI
jgi:hypothetical protein